MLHTARVEAISTDLQLAKIVDDRLKEERQDSAQRALKNESNISERALVMNESTKEFSELMKIWGDLYDKEHNPNGIISMGVAENNLMEEELCNFFNEKVKLKPHHLTYGNGPGGSGRLRTNLADFFNDYFKPLHPVTKDHIMTTAGASAVVDAVSYVTCDQGDGILIGRPLYAGFKGDLTIRSRVHLVAVSLKEVDPMSIDAIGLYEEELKNQVNKGTRIKAMILCNPHNPLGQCYSKETIIEYMRFCQKYQIHLISDEVYALSLYDTSDNGDFEKFTSVLSIDLKGIIDERLVHVVYSMSKDFDANGFRIGCLVSQNNEELLKAAGTMGIFAWPGSYSDNAWATLLEDKEFLKYYVEENQKRLGQQRDVVGKFLDKWDIPYIKGNAGFFLWADFRKYLPKLSPEDYESDEEKEEAAVNGVEANGEATETDALLPSENISTNSTKESKEKKLKFASNVPNARYHDWKRDSKFFDQLVEGRVHLANSSHFFSEEHGFYRITFSVPTEQLQLGLSKLEKVLEAAKKNLGTEAEECSDGVKKGLERAEQL